MRTTLEDCRLAFAKRIRREVKAMAPALVEAFGRVPREKYLGPGPWRILPISLLTEDPRDLYNDVLVAIDSGRGLNNGQPSALALWISALDLNAGDRVFHLGCGLGYYTAIMAEVVGPRGSVVAIEVDPGLAARARENLSAYANVCVHAGDGGAFDPGTCDAMFINAGVTHPRPLWLDRLSGGGRLVLPLTQATSPVAGSGVMARIARSGDFFSARPVSTVGIYSCTSVRDPQLEVPIARAIRTGAIFRMKSIRRDVHEPTGSCLLHGIGVCLSSEEPVPADRN
jgi:protein-L-isoaspartate(D-aspartate) O-methyltransferase